MVESWVPLEGVDLLAGVRDILVENPARHDQSLWIGNAFVELGTEERVKVPVDQIRVHMFQPFPADPMDADVPPCGTTGCAIGWGGVLSAPTGSFVSNGRIHLPDGQSYYLPEWVGPRMGFTDRDVSFVFSPARTREQIIDILNARIDDPEADIRSLVYPEM